MQKVRHSDLYLYLAISATVLSVVYWSLVSVQTYYNLGNTFDMAQIESSMYYLVNYPSIVGGLQSIVFATHIAPDQFLVLPFFYAYQSGITLLIVQATLLSITGLAVFLILRDLGLSDLLSLSLCIVFLLNPGMHGLILHDYHVEFLLPLFVLTTFYFYMKLKWKWFALSLLLLLFTLDDAAFVILFLGVGLAYYDFIYTKDKAVRKKRLKFAATIVMSSIVVFIAYTLITNSLITSYFHSTQYDNMPQYLRVLPYGFYLPTNITNTTNSTSFHIPSVALGSQFVYPAAIAIVVGIFAFGISVFSDPLLTLLLVAPGSSACCSRTRARNSQAWHSTTSVT